MRSRISGQARDEEKLRKLLRPSYVRDQRRLNLKLFALQVVKAGQCPVQRLNLRGHLSRQRHFPDNIIGPETAVEVSAKSSKSSLPVTGASSRSATTENTNPCATSGLSFRSSALVHRIPITRLPISGGSPFEIIPQQDQCKSVEH